MKVKTFNISELNENSVKTINVGDKDISIFTQLIVTNCVT